MPRIYMINIKIYFHRRKRRREKSGYGKIIIMRFLKMLNKKEPSDEFLLPCVLKIYIVILLLMSYNHTLI
jgi:hypothetical protein